MTSVVPRAGGGWKLAGPPRQVEIELNQHIAGSSRFPAGVIASNQNRRTSVQLAPRRPGDEVVGEDLRERPRVLLVLAEVGRRDLLDFENLEDGAQIGAFVEWFPGVTLEQARAVLEHAARSLEAA
jgi:hypothetical protein